MSITETIKQNTRENHRTIVLPLYLLHSFYSVAVCHIATVHYSLTQGVHTVQCSRVETGSGQSTYLRQMCHFFSGSCRLLDQTGSIWYILF